MFAGLKTGFFSLWRANVEESTHLGPKAKKVGRSYGIIIGGLSCCAMLCLSVRGGARNHHPQIRHTHTQQALVSEPATATLSTLLLAAICGIASQCTEEEVGFVIGVIGAVLGTGVVYIIPALLNGKLLDRVKDVKAALPEKRLNRAIVAMGAVFACLGTYAALEEHFPGLISGLWGGKAPVAKVKLH